MDKSPWRKLAIILLLVLCAGCTPGPSPKITQEDLRYSIVCIDGVEYLYGYRGHGIYLTPHVHRDGTLYLCGENNARYDW